MLAVILRELSQFNVTTTHAAYGLIVNEISDHVATGKSQSELAKLVVNGTMTLQGAELAMDQITDRSQA